MSKKPMLTAYVSDIDQLLQHFDKEHPELSASQRQERDKYQKLHALRDKIERVDETKTLWDKF